jgi:hypothetical protein
MQGLFDFRFDGGFITWYEIPVELNFNVSKISGFKRQQISARRSISGSFSSLLTVDITFTKTSQRNAEYLNTRCRIFFALS